MRDPAIRVHALGKRYRLGAAEEPYQTLRDALARAASAPLRRLRGKSSGDLSQLWAIRDLSFEIGQGESIGVIGRNGAGKSTLLKILSKITQPTEGFAEIRGRVGSLLEVGTGFHPELTGRENIFLNGAILGMKRREIRDTFDEIVAFAEVERFLDTPVKHYSSGMYMRLAFAVAAHLQPETLLIDEVLAVGDAAFQKKCLGKVSDVARSGRTVLFVSHNMAAIRNTCSRVIWLDQGRVRADGPASEVVREYLQIGSSTVERRTWDDPATAPGNDAVRLSSVRILPSSGPLTVRTPFSIEFEYWNLRPETRLNLSMSVYNQEDIPVFVSTTATDEEWHGRPFPAGLFRSTCEIPANLMNDGVYRVVLMVVKDSAIVLHREDDVITFEIHDDPAERDGWYGKWIGVVRPRLTWRTELDADESSANDIQQRIVR